MVCWCMWCTYDVVCCVVGGAAAGLGAGAHGGDLRRALVHVPRGLLPSAHAVQHPARRQRALRQLPWHHALHRNGGTIGRCGVTSQPHAAHAAPTALVAPYSPSPSCTLCCSSVVPHTFTVLFSYSVHCTRMWNVFYVFYAVVSARRARARARICIRHVFPERISDPAGA